MTLVNLTCSHPHLTKCGFSLTVDNYVEDKNDAYDKMMREMCFV